MTEADIGAAGPAFEWVVERGKIREFARACLDDNPAFDGSDAVAPPTFPMTASTFWQPPGSRRGLARPFELRRLLHGEQEFEYARPLRAGEVLIGRTRLKDYFEKPGRRGGVMRFAVYETEFRERDTKRPVAWARATIIETAKAATE